MDHHYRAWPQPVVDLAVALREHAAGIYAHRAAVELLVDHGVFLGRQAFRDEFVRGVRRSTGAYVRWAAVATALNQHRLACSSSEDAILRIAASLGGDVAVRLSHVLGGLDTANMGRVMDAVAVANNGRPHRCLRVVAEQAAMDMDMMSADAPLARIWPVRGQPGLPPALLWDDLVPGLASAAGGVLACPWCGLSSNLHLARIYYATPAPDYYPSFGVDIDVMAAMVTRVQRRAQLHGDANTGVMLTVEVWCDNGCRGRLEFRQHIDTQEGLDVVVLNLEELPGFPPDYFDPDGVDLDHGSGPITVGQADPTEPPF